MYLTLKRSGRLKRSGIEVEEVLGLRLRRSGLRLRRSWFEAGEV